MKTRVYTGAIIVLLVATAFVSRLLTPYIFDAFIGAVAVVAVVEMTRTFERMKKYCNITVAPLFIPCAYLGISLAIFFKLNLLWTALIILGVLLLLTILAGVIPAICVKNTRAQMTKYAYTKSYARFCLDKSLYTFVIMLYPGALFVVLFLINRLSSFNYSPMIETGMIEWAALALTFAIAMLTDTFAMLVGSIFHGPKLCPRISPNKTISGAIGGLFGGIFASSLVFLIFMTQSGFVDMMSTLNFGYWHFMLIGVVGSIMDQVGDILASFVKRCARIKDYGTLLPGHGGIMDRVDGLIFVALIIFGFTFFII